MSAEVHVNSLEYISTESKIIIPSQGTHDSCSAHDYMYSAVNIASVYRVNAAHKRKPRETKNVRKLIILFDLIIAF